MDFIKFLRTDGGFGLCRKISNFCYFKERSITYILGKKKKLIPRFFFYFRQHINFYVLSLWDGPKINGDIP